MSPEKQTTAADPEPQIPEDEVGIPALLRAARGSYGHAIRSNFAEGGFSDMPRNGAFVLGGMVNYGIEAGRLVRQLGVSRQAASQLIDTLVLRGYLERSPHPEDRRRVNIEATERGRAAAEAVRSAVAAVDEELAENITPVQLAGLRAGLIALCDIRDRLEVERAAAALLES
jgi:DNA-binding MarR family transcriptional regulator